MKLFLALALSLILSVPQSALAAASKNPDVYTYLTISDADSLDYAYAYDTASHSLILNIYEPLYMFDGSSTEKMIPILATKVPTAANGLVTNGGKTYTIPIRKGVKFHDGSEMTPEDVKYSIQRFMALDRDAGPSPLIMEPLLGYPNSRENGKLKPSFFKDLERAVQVKGDNVVLNLPKAYAPLNSILVSWGVIVSKKWAIANGDWDGTEAGLAKINNSQKQATPFYNKANGTGPFKLDRWDHRTKETHLVRHDAYWRKPAKLKRVIVKGLNEAGTRKLMLAAGDGDNVYADRAVYSQFANIPGVEIIDGLPTMEQNPMGFFTFKINAAGNPNVGSGKLDGNGIPPDFFSDVDVRKGFAYAFDYEALKKDVFMGKAKKSRGVIPSSLFGHDPNGKVYEKNHAKAAEHFKKAWGGQVWEKGFKFTLTFNSANTVRQNLTQIWKKNVEAINPKFRVEVRAIEWPTFLDQYKASKLPLFVMGWSADYPDAHTFTFPILHSKGDYPQVQKWGRPDFDKLVEEGNEETDPAKRKKIYAKLEAMAFDFAANVPFFETLRYRTQRDWVNGFVPNPVFPDSPYSSYYYPMSKD
jgi:peptide/nickel transport system substrate-binding protein